MEQITIDFKNAFDCSKKEKSKVCRSGMYVCGTVVFLFAA